MNTADLVREFNALYYRGLPGKERQFTTLSWMGVPILKCPEDLFMYQEIIAETAPDVIVECGVFRGGSTLYLAQLCELLNRGRVLAVDVTLERVHSVVGEHPRVELLEGSSVDEAIVEAIREKTAGQRVMVILDSDHRAAHVSRELRAYGPMVTPGCYMIVEDTNINGHPVPWRGGPGPFEAVAEFLSETSGWTADARRERLLVTFNPNGYLLRDGAPRAQ